MPAENDPAEPNALTQSWQLTCSLTPSSTVPSTRLVIIWLKRWSARPLIEAPLESAPVTGGGSGATAAGGGGGGVVTWQGPSQQLSKHSSSAWACPIAANEHAEMSAAEIARLRTSLITISARTACRDRRRARVRRWRDR